MNTSKPFSDLVCLIKIPKLNLDSLNKAQVELHQSK